MDNLGFSLLFHLWPLAKMWIVSIVVLSGNSEKKHFFYGKLHVGFRNQAHLPW